LAPSLIRPWSILLSRWSRALPSAIKTLQPRQVPLKPPLALAALPKQTPAKRRGRRPVLPSLVPQSLTRPRPLRPWQIRRCLALSSLSQTVRHLPRRSRQPIRANLSTHRLIRVMDSLRELLQRQQRVLLYPSRAHPCRHLPPHRCRLACRLRLRRVQPQLCHLPPLLSCPPVRQRNPGHHVHPRPWRRHGRWLPARLQPRQRLRDPRGQSNRPASRLLPARARGTPGRLAPRGRSTSSKSAPQVARPC
jgi:hypothetical protein